MENYCKRWPWTALIASSGWGKWLVVAHVQEAGVTLGGNRKSMAVVAMRI